jgi:hypothetical protein
MLLDDPVPFYEALKVLGEKDALPTTLDSAGIKKLAAGVRRQSLFSAQTNLGDYLEDIRMSVHSILEPGTAIDNARKSESNPDGKVTTGLDPASARLKLKDALKKYGYSPESGTRGTIKDLSSDARINLVVKTNVELAQGSGRYIQENSDPDVVDLFPALELVRFEARAKPRDWADRWRQAADDSGDDDAARMLQEHGRMVARKDSPIWDSLGSSDLFDDALDNPFPPFAFNSGMWTQEVSRDEAVKLGLIEDGDQVEARPLDIEALFNFGRS